MTIYEQARQVISELLEQAQLRPGQLVVIGCSTSEVTGHRIGSDSSMATAQQLYDAIAPVIAEKGCYLAAQCC